MSIYKSSSKLAILKNPASAIQFAMGNKTAIHRQIILKSARHIFEKIDPLEWGIYLKEITSDQIIQKSTGANAQTGNTLNTTFGKWIYCVTRFLKPRIMVETGVAHGNSSWIILNAIHKNGLGKLYSFDLPNHDTNDGYNIDVNRCETGWLVPNELRKPWHLIFGDTKDALPSFFRENPEIDIFFHDSGHSYEHMKFEFENSWPHIRKGGILLSDDVDKNQAFFDFTDKNSIRAIEFNKGGCGIKK